MGEGAKRAKWKLLSIIVKNSYLIKVVMEIVDAMIQNKTLGEWHHLKPKRLSKIGESFTLRFIKR